MDEGSTYPWGSLTIRQFQPRAAMSRIDTVCGQKVDTDMPTWRLAKV